MQASEWVLCTSNNLLAMEYFNVFSLASGLEDCGYMGSKFTWARKEHSLLNKFARLNNIFTTGHLHNSFHLLEGKHLAMKY